MSLFRSVVLVFILAFPYVGSADVAPGDLPKDTVWYLHANLERMRDSAAGRDLYRWLDGEVLIELHDKIGIDVNKEVNSITAFSAEENGTVVIVKGPMTAKSQNELMSRTKLEATVTEKKHGQKAYFMVLDEDEKDDMDHTHHGSNDALKDLEDGAFVSFALKDMLIVTGNEAQMKELLDNNGRVAGGDAVNGALFVLTADKSFVQAGLDTNQLADDGDTDWDSNIIRNTKQVAMTISDLGDMIAVEAHLVSMDASIASSLGGIVNGLIALQAFNSDLSQNVKSLLANTKIQVKDNILSINTVIAPGLIVDMLND
jgi:hypothetical protein